MRVGLVAERKRDFPAPHPDIPELDSELLSDAEEATLIAGLQEAGHEVVNLGDVQSLLKRIDQIRGACDLVLNLSVGYGGVERKLHAAAILESAGVPYVGSTGYVHTLTRHKYHAKLVAAAGGIHTPPAVLIDSLHGVTNVDFSRLRFPAIVKPLAESSSIGLDAQHSLVRDRDAALARAQAMIVRHRQPALVETFVPGLELEVPLLVDPEPRALGVVAITVAGVPLAGDEFLTSDVVYGDGYGFADPPAHVDRDAVIEAAVRAAKLFGIRDYGRIDFRLDAAGTPWFIEASTQPHLLPHSSLFWLAERRGLSYAQFLDEILGVAARRY